MAYRSHCPSVSSFQSYIDFFTALPLFDCDDALALHIPSVAAQPITKGKQAAAARNIHQQEQEGAEKTRSKRWKAARKETRAARAMAMAVEKEAKEAEEAAEKASWDEKRARARRGQSA
ncbi:hypothetical protein MMC22_002834 [Lobaria immixta]|nr:hypothetical protein [Lobaria immixta]